MKKQNLEIEKFLKGKTLSYTEGLALYSSHPAARKNAVRAMVNTPDKATTHFKLIYELEKLVGVKKYSNRSSVILENEDFSTSKVIVKSVAIVAPEKFEYAVKYEVLPEYLQESVIEKGQLYNHLALKKKELAHTGQANDADSIAKRKKLRDEIKAYADRIVEIHNLVKNYCEKEPGTEENMELKTEEKALSWEGKKLLLKRTQSNVTKQLKRAKEGSVKTREKNAQKAKAGQELIEELNLYFSKNPVAPK